MPTVLVVDDEARTRRLVGVVLRTAGFDVLDAEDGDSVVALVKAQQPEAVVLDLKMPGVSGLEALRALRAAGEDVPVIMLTGVLDEEWVVNAFEAGADDYVTKPFAPRVLLARVQAVLRRARGVGNDHDAGPDEQTIGEMSLDPRTRSIRVGDQQVTLTPTEYHLLRTLMRSAGRVFTTAELLAHVLGAGLRGPGRDRARQHLPPAP